MSVYKLGINISKKELYDLLKRGQITANISLDRIKALCNAERDGRLVDAQELYNRLKVAEFCNPPNEIKDYSKGYNKAIGDLTTYMVYEYGVKPLSAEQAEKALEGLK